MGLDAFVACNCLRDGKLSNPLEPFTMDDVYRDAEGLLSSRMLDCFLVQLGFEEYMRCYGALDRRFSDWLDKPCEHEGESILASAYLIGRELANFDLSSQALVERSRTRS